ncbi:MAG: hypothetical protein HYS98_08960 [Deltaproteobacteria bacterium]|nr:hypothetical protein [Deltaproteobacteria bacterium]
MNNIDVQEEQKKENSKRTYVKWSQDNMACPVKNGCLPEKLQKEVDQILEVL